MRGPAPSVEELYPGQEERSSWRGQKSCGMMRKNTVVNLFYVGGGIPCTIPVSIHPLWESSFWRRTMRPDRGVVCRTKILCPLPGTGLGGGGRFRLFAQVKQWLALYFAGQEPELEIPIHMVGTAFQKAVWRILRTIPYGQTMTYGAIARQVAEELGIRRMSPRRWGRSGTQSNFHPYPMPPGGGDQRQPDGICRRHSVKKSGSSPSNRRTCPDCSSRKSNSPCGSKRSADGYKRKILTTCRNLS